MTLSKLMASFGLATVALVNLGCLQTSPTSSLVGTWAVDGDPRLLKFSSDGQFEGEFDGDPKNPEIRGRFSTNETYLVISNEEGPAKCDRDAARDTYTYAVQSSQLTITATKPDECRGRQNFFQGTWIKK